MSDNRQAALDRLLANSAEIITEDEFKERINSGDELTHYIGFEISGYVHLGTGIMTALVIKDLLELDVKCTIWLADWHTFINEKLDGTLETAQKIGQGYFTEAIKASLKAVGADLDKVDFRLASEWYDKEPAQYWNYVISGAKNTTLSRMQRSIDIMGREEGDSVDFAKLMYPTMQVADIFYQDIDIAHAGMDQRKAHVIMRDVADRVRPDKPKPIAIHHPLLVGASRRIYKEELTQKDRESLERAQSENIVSHNQLREMVKMSKSNTDTALFIHDSEEQIIKKVNKTFLLPTEEVKKLSEEQFNALKDFIPTLNWTKHILFWNRKDLLAELAGPFRIERKKEHGGGVEFNSYDELEKAYSAGDIHPADLKTAVAKELIELLKHARDHFAKKEVAAKKAELDKLLAKS